MFGSIIFLVYPKITKSFAYLFLIYNVFSSCNPVQYINIAQTLGIRATWMTIAIIVGYPGVKQSLIVLNVTFVLIFYVTYPILFRDFLWDLKLLVWGILFQTLFTLMAFSFMCIITLITNLLSKIEQ